MKTKAEIVQRLLESKQVDAEEAVILLMSDKEVQYIPYVPYNPYPYYPIGPIWVGSTASPTITIPSTICFTTNN